MNRLLLWAASPRAILRATSLRWGSLHRGSTLDARTPDERSAEITLAFPPRLLPEIVLRGNGEGISVALEGAGARDVEVDLRNVKPSRAVFYARWEPTEREEKEKGSAQVRTRRRSVIDRMKRERPFSDMSAWLLPNLW